MGKQPKGRAPVLDVGELEETGNDRDAFMEGYASLDDQLGQPVQKQDDGGNEQEVFTHRVGAAHGLRSCAAFQFAQDRAAALAYRWIGLIFAHMNRVIPAAVAFLALGTADLHGDRSSTIAGLLLQGYGGNDKQVTQLVAVTVEHRVHGVGGGNLDLSFERLAD